MKIILTIIVLLLAAANAVTAQSPNNDASDVTVIKKSWRTVLDLPPVAGSSPAAVNGAVLANQTAQAENKIANNQRIKQGKSPVNSSSTPFPKTPTDQAQSDRDPHLPQYLYSIQLKNSGSKAISKIVCDYVFTDPKTGKEIGRREISGVDIPAGKSKKFTLKTTSAPDNSRNLLQVSGAKERTYTEAVVIDKIEYSDGSVWSINK